MHTPAALTPLFDDGILERVARPLRSGKEAEVFLVVSRGQMCVAKVYKDLDERSFKNRADYTEGRKTRNFGRWRKAERVGAGAPDVDRILEEKHGAQRETPVGKASSRRR